MKALERDTATREKDAPDITKWRATYLELAEDITTGKTEINHTENAKSCSLFL